jgi:hypothetical protein
MRGREKKGKGKAGPFEQSGIVWVGKGKRKKMEYVVVMGRSRAVYNARRY